MIGILDAIALRIIEEQERVIGPLAWDQAEKVAGLRIVDRQKHEVVVEGQDPKSTVNNLVEQYNRLFGRASQEVCKEAASSITATMPRDMVPASLLT